MRRPIRFTFCTEHTHLQHVLLVGFGLRAMNYLEGPKNEYGPETREDLDRFLNATYWSRTWMVQEIVLAQEWYIMCNERILDGDRLMLYCAYGSLDGNASVLNSRAFKIVEERELSKLHGKSTLVNLLCRFLELNSACPVDKIRALLALCSEDTSALDKLLRPLADKYQECGLHPKAKKKICDEVIDLSKDSGLERNQWAQEACRQLVAGLLGVNMEYLAAQLGTLYGVRRADWIGRTRGIGPIYLENDEEKKMESPDKWPW